MAKFYLSYILYIPEYDAPPLTVALAEFFSLPARNIKGIITRDAAMPFPRWRRITMVCVNAAVVHKVFGHGTVTATDGKYITVRFHDIEKKFVYPDVFDGFMTLEGDTPDGDIARDIEESKKYKQSIMDKKKEENEFAKKRGIVVPGKIITAEEEEDESSFKDFEKEDPDL